MAKAAVTGTYPGIAGELAAQCGYTCEGCGAQIIDAIPAERCEACRTRKRYRTIVADPPWDYGDGHVTASSGTGPGQRPTWLGVPFTKPLPYGSMTVDKIAALPVVDLADPAGALLFLWTTSRYLPAAFGVLEAWGFTYRQTLVWHKVKSVTYLGGAVAPNHAEFLLLARRGAARLAGRLRSSVVVAPGNSGRRVGAHSRKPEVFLDHIESVSPGPYVELFARRARFGWDTWGDESLGTAEMIASG